jgi:hypothetical protein
MATCSGSAADSSPKSRDPRRAALRPRGGVPNHGLCLRFHGDRLLDGKFGNNCRKQAITLIEPCPGPRPIPVLGWGCRNFTGSGYPPKPLTLPAPAVRLASISSYRQDTPLKVYRATRQLLADVERMLVDSRPSARHSPLEDVIDLLCHGRHYAWVGIFLAVGESTPQQLLGAGGGDAPGEVALPETRSKILISMKLASRELGVLSVESDRENAFGAEDRVLLEDVADVLALFLAGRGKYLVRKARTDASRMGRAGTPVLH